MNTLRRSFVAVQHDVRHPYVVHINENGQEEWKYEILFALDLQRLPHGGFLVNGPQDIIELDAQLREVWRYHADEPELIGCRRLDNGDTLIGDTSLPGMFAVAPDGSRSWEFAFPREPEEESHYMFRMTRPMRNGNMLVACHHQRRVAEFTRQGAVVWEHALEQGPYEALELSNGHILVSTGPGGTIVELSKREGQVWEFRMDRDMGVQTSWIAGVVPLGDGSVVFSDSKNDQIVEVDRDCKVVGVFHDPERLLHPSSLVVLT